MNKYLYKIKDLEVPPWIKYWFLRKSKINFDLSQILNGTSFDLTDTVNKKLHLINIFGNSVQKTLILPSEYQQVDYIESTGTQYIDTNIIPDVNTKLETNFAITDTSVLNYMGSALNNNDGFFEFGMTGTGQASALFSVNSGDGAIIPGYADNNYHTYYVSNGLQKVDEVEGTNSITSFNRTMLSIYLFRRHIEWEGTSYCYAKLKYCKIWQGENIVRNFIPCYRKSDSVIGLYDLISNSFFTNVGTGTFSKGNDVLIPNPNYPQEVNSSGDNGSITEKFSNSDNSQSQVYTIPCQQPMRAIGDVKDTFVKENGVWYERHNINRISLKDFEFQKYEVTQGNLFRTSTVVNGSLEDFTVLSNIFIGILNSVGRVNNNIYYNSNNDRIDIICNDYNTIEDFETMLENKDGYVDIIRLTSLDLPCTQAQITALEALMKARTYKNITHIYSEDEVPADLEIQYYKEKGE